MPHFNEIDFIFSLYTPILHDLLKSPISSIVHNSFEPKNRATRYTRSQVEGNHGSYTKSLTTDEKNK